MENSLLNKIYDSLISENIPYNKETGHIYKKIRKKYKKGNFQIDENDFFCDIAELVYIEQKYAFEIGAKFTFKLLNEVIK